MVAVRGLTKRYGRTTAVDRLSFEVRPAVKPIPYSLSPWTGLAVLMVHAAVVAGAGTALLARRDA